jgi:hypothetical protein
MQRLLMIWSRLLVNPNRGLTSSVGWTPPFPKQARQEAKRKLWQGTQSSLRFLLKALMTASGPGLARL